MKKKITFPYKGFSSVTISEDSIIDIIKPGISKIIQKPTEKIIEDSINNPVGLSLKDLLKGSEKVLILVDDYTRTTPVEIILPILIDEIRQCKIVKENIKIMIASGTHRIMKYEEKLNKYGKEIVSNFNVIDHLWFEHSELVSLGSTERGTEIWINRIITEFDFIIGIGHIVPHRVSGFSGGAKIVQPGICGNITTGQTHWLSALFNGEEIMGKIDNPVREEINSVGVKAGLKFIINTVQDGSGKVYKCFAGDPIKAFKEGCFAAKDIFGFNIPSQADIVLTDSYPADTNLWQASKGVYSGDLALKSGGTLILVTPCPEGVSDEHPEIIKYGYQSYEQIKKLLDNGMIKDLTLAAHLVHVGRVIKEKGNAILVSKGINKDTTEKLGFYWASNAQDAVELAFSFQGKNSNIMICKNGGEIMPVFAR